MKIKSLKSRQDSLAQTEKQLEILSGGIFKDGSLPTFKEKVKASNLEAVRPIALEILQINVGYMCNQVCAHCHVDAGPDRKEIMTHETMEQILVVLQDNKIKTVDLTGGAPEMHPEFRWFVEEIRKTSVEEIIVRSNLTIILANKKYHDLPEFSLNIRFMSFHHSLFTKEAKQINNEAMEFSTLQLKHYKCSIRLDLESPMAPLSWIWSITLPVLFYQGIKKL